MYYKLSSIVLNSGKNLKHSGDVHISQPSVELEALAGNFFVIVEMSDKRLVSQKICDFLVSKLEEHYYGDHKLFLTDKIEGLKIASIFEAALAKTNHDFAAFLQEENLTLDSGEDGLTLGLIYQNKLYFSIFGKNKAFLIYRKNGEYDILNVESSAQESEEDIIVGEDGQSRAKVFSAVIQGEIPPYSYFVFTNEALPEYLSSQDMISMAVKLPPVVACEQMKNVLSAINSFIPFLGIVIKNVYNTQDNVEGARAVESLTAHESISNLNYTERKTEKMLSPAGLIDLRKLAGRVKDSLKFKLPSINKLSERKLAWREQSGGSSEMRKDSFMLKDKIVLKKQARHWALNVKRGVLAIASLFRPSFWHNLWLGTRAWFAHLSRANRLILASLSVILVILVTSVLIQLSRNEQKDVQEQFAAAQQLIQDKSDSVDAYLLYNNRQGAQGEWQAVSATLAALPQEKEYQKAEYSRLQGLAMTLHDKAYGINRVDNLEKVWEAGEGQSLVGGTFAAGQAFLVDADNKKLSVVSLGDKTVKESALDYDLSQMNSRIFAYEDTVYMLQASGLIEYDIAAGSSRQISLPQMSSLSDIGGWGVFITNPYDNIYLADTAQNQIFRYRVTNSAGARTPWLQEEASLGDAISMYVDGNLYILHSDGRIDDFYLNKKTDVSFDALEGQLSSASFLLSAGEDIAVSDLKNKTLAVWDKEGHLKQQYIFSGLDTLLTLGLSDDGQTAYLFDGKAVYSTPLSQE